MRRHGRGSRVARGAVAASVATFVALVSHVSAGGAVPGPVGIVVPLTLSFVACTALAGRRLSAWRSGVVVAISQALFHLLFVLGSYEPGAGAHVHGAAIALATEGVPTPAVTMDAAMAAGHLIAGVVTALALHRGERTLTALGTLAARCVAWVRARVRVTAFGPTPVRRVQAVVVARVQPVSVIVTRTSARRGPPVAAS